MRVGCEDGSDTYKLILALRCFVQVENYFPVEKCPYQTDKHRFHI